MAQCSPNVFLGLSSVSWPLFLLSSFPYSLQIIQFEPCFTLFRFNISLKYLRLILISSSEPRNHRNSVDVSPFFCCTKASLSRSVSSPAAAYCILTQHKGFSLGYLLDPGTLQNSTGTVHPFIHLVMNSLGSVWNKLIKMKILLIS